MPDQQPQRSFSKTCTIKFFKGVDEASINALMAVVEQKLREGTEQFVLLISTPGGTVYHGLAAYNFLKGIPAEIVTHNFGSVDSIGVVLYCAGTKRYSVPHARFLLHAVQAQFHQSASLEGKQLEERLKGLQIDIRNIARVIAANTGKTEQEVTRAMLITGSINVAHFRPHIGPRLYGSSFSLSVVDAVCSGGSAAHFL